MSGSLAMISISLASGSSNTFEGNIVCGLSSRFLRANRQSASKIAESWVTAGPWISRLRSCHRLRDRVGPMYSFPMLRPPIIAREWSKWPVFGAYSDWLNRMREKVEPVQSVRSDLQTFRATAYRVTSYPMTLSGLKTAAFLRRTGLFWKALSLHVVRLVRC